MNGEANNLIFFSWAIIEDMFNNFFIIIIISNQDFTVCTYTEIDFQNQTYSKKYSLT